MCGEIKSRRCGETELGEEREKEKGRRTKQ
jgi:hypothetical protein